MKRLLIIISLALLLPAVAAVAVKKEAKIKFTEEKFDFGTVAEHGGKVTHSFEFTNTGNANLVIIDAQADCGCTVPEYPSKPIAPGQKGVIKVIFNPLYRPGAFNKVITVKSNAKPKKSRIRITGTVTPGK